MVQDSAKSKTHGTLESIRLHIANILSSWQLARNISIAAATVIVQLALLGLDICCLIIATMHEMLKVDLRSLEPFACIDEPPDDDCEL